MLHLLQMVPFKVLTTLLLWIQNSRQLLLLSCFPCGIPAFPEGLTICLPLWVPSVCILPLFNLIHLGPICQCIPLAPPSYSNLQHSFRLLRIFPSLPSSLPHASDCFFIPLPFSSSTDSLRVLHWVVGGLRVKSTELLCFVSSHPVHLICTHESNLN